MKIAFNPSTVAALTTPPNNKDITFDLRGRNIFARGVKFCGTDTWRDIKINNVSIGSHTLDLRNGSNTTLTNTNGVVTINSTWRPVVDNLTSDSTTSSLSANQGRVLKSLIDGKSNSGHTHDDRYLKLTGGTMTGNIILSRSTAIIKSLASTSHYDSIVSWSVDGETKKYGREIGLHNTGGDSTGSIAIVPYKTDTDPWSGNVGLFIAKNTLKLDGKPIALKSDIPTSLKNPYSLNVFGVTYDGSAAKVVSPSNFISQLEEVTSTVTDGTMFITSWASDSGFADTNAVNVPYKRKAIHLWEYIKAKTDSLYTTKGHNHDDRYLKLTGGIMTGTINRRSGGSTISGRDHAIIRQTYAPGGSSWNPIACVDTETGTWTLGHLSSGDSDTNFHFCFSTNTDYNAGNNNGNYVTLRNKVGTIALLSDVPTSLKNPHALTISLNGTSQGPYDGSAAKNINITPSSIGAATSNHTHPYLPLSGGTVTGNIILKGGTSADMTYAGNVHPYIRFDNSDSSQNVSLIFTDYDTYKRPAGIKLVGNQGNEWFEAANIYATTFYGALSGNASSANKLTTARNIALGTDLRGSANFDGSSNITISANINACTVQVGSTNGLPFKRIAHFETGSSWNDNALLLYISQGYIYGSNGICRVEFRTDNISSSSTSVTASAAVRWLVRNGYGLDSLYAGYYVTTSKAYIDIYLKTTDGYQGTVIRVLQDSRGGINSNVQLINSYYYSDTNYKEAYNSIEAASTALYNRAYTRIVSGSDVGTVSYSNSTGSVHWNNVTNKPSTFAPSAHSHDGRYLRLDGSDTMTGVFKAKANQFNDGYDGAINMNNSDIYGLNSIYTADRSDAQAEGIHFWRDSTHVDTLRMVDGKLLFTPNRPLGGSGTEQTVLHTGNSYIQGSTITINGSSITPLTSLPSHTHSWTSITDKLVAGNEFNIVNAGFNDRMWFNYLPINDRSKTATITGYHFGNGNRGYATVTAWGFAKNGSSSSYVLLGDGGHKTISSLSVNYANSAGNAATATHASFADYICSGTLPTPANNTVKAYKDSLAKFFKDIRPNGGVGANVNVSESIISNWSNDSATYHDSSTYCFIKIGGAYAGATYGQFLLSSYNLSKVGIVGRNSSQWSKIKWLAYEDQIPTDNNQLANGAGYITSAGSCAYANSAGSATKVIVNQHTTNDVNYPLVWSNQSNTNSVTENQLYKSWSDLYYNPKNKRLTVGGSVVASSFVKSGGTSQQLLRADGEIATFNWSGQSGQPTWLWGGNNQHSYYVYNPSNFRVAYASSAGNADTLDGIDSTKFLRQVVVPNNTENDFNIFSNMTLTGRADPTTGASLKNAPWSGSGPAGGYGVLTYLFNGYDYGTQMAWEYGSNRIYIRNRYWGGSGVGLVWRTSWDKLALTSDIPSSLKNPYTLTLKANGTTLAIYDGSSAKEANFTYANVGAASASHTHSNYVTDLGTSGNYLTWTKNGNTSNITVPYAGKTDWLISQGSFSTKEQVDAFFDTVNHSLKVAYIGNKAFPEFSDGLVLAASVPKSYCHQIHMDDKQPVIHHRARNGDGSGWSKWSKLLDSSNYSSYAIPVSASCNKNWSYSGQSDQPTWLWGTNDGTNCYVWNPSNFSVAKSEYSRSLLGRSTSGSDYDTNSSNLVFAEWNTMNDSRWYLKATDYECRVDYANSAGSVSNSLNIFGVSYNGSAAKTVTTSTFVSQLPEATGTVTDGTMFITSVVSNSGFADTNAVNVPYKRKASCLWNYIDNKVSSKYLPLAGGTMNGNARIGHGSGNLYIGNSGNDGWIYTQNIASQKGTDKWSIRESGAANFGALYIASKTDNSFNSNVIECNSTINLNYFSSQNVSLCNGGGTVQIGSYTTGDTGNNKLYVNGSEFINGASNVKDHVFANGFRHRSHNSDDAVLLAGGGYSQGVPVRYWAIYYMYIGNSSTDITYTKRSGNYDFITSEAWESEGSARFDISFPSGYNKNNTLIFGNGDHRTSSQWKTSVYVTITTSTAFGLESQIRVMISDDANLNVGFANIYFMCMG